MYVFDLEKICLAFSRLLKFQIIERLLFTIEEPISSVGSCYFPPASIELQELFADLLFSTITDTLEYNDSIMLYFNENNDIMMNEELSAIINNLPELPINCDYFFEEPTFLEITVIERVKDNLILQFRISQNIAIALEKL